MKRILMAALAVCVLFAGCAKDNEGVSNTDEQSILVKFPQGTTFSDSRASLVENPVTTLNPVQTLSNAIVYLLNGNAVVSVHNITSEDITNGYKKFNDVSSTINGVLVVANVPSGDLSALGNASNVSFIENYPFSITSQSTTGITAKTLIGKTYTLTTTTPNPDAGSGDTDTYKVANIDLDALIARFEVGSVVAGNGVKSVELVGLWINSYYTDYSRVAPIDAATGFNNSESQYWLTDPSTISSPSTTPFTTVAFNGTTLKGNNYSPTEYYNARSAEVILAAGSKVYAFHVFAGANIPHLLLLVKGEYEDGYYVDGQKYFLGWVTFTKYLDNATGVYITEINRNVIYKMGVGTTGISINADELTPYPEMTRFDLGLKCTIMPWTEKTVTPAL